MTNEQKTNRYIQMVALRRNIRLKLLEERRKVREQAEEIAELKSRVKLIKGLLYTCMDHMQKNAEKGTE